MTERQKPGKRTKPDKLGKPTELGASGSLGGAKEQGVEDGQCSRGSAKESMEGAGHSHERQDLLARAFPFYEDLYRAERDLLAQQARELHWEAGRVLMEEGITCRNIFWIVSGGIRVYKLSPDGREVTLYRIAPGDTCLISAACIMNSRAFPAIAETEMDTELLVVPAELFRRLLQSSSALQQYVLGKSLERLADVIQVIDTMAFTSRRTALANFLWQRVQETKHPAVTITHQALAVELGTAREVVSRTLKELQNQGIVRLGRGRIHVVDEAALAELARS